MATVGIAFSGSAETKRIAAAAFELLLGHGRFMSLDQPIRVSASSLVSALNRDGGELTPERLMKVVIANAEVFAVETVEGDAFVLTTRTGQRPRDPQPDVRHTFQQRFLTPKPKPEVPVAPVRERARVDPSWATLDDILRPFDLSENDELDDVEVVDLPPAEVAAARQVAPVREVAPVQIEEPVRAERVPVEPIAAQEERVPVEPIAAEQDRVEPAPMPDVVAAPEPVSVVFRGAPAAPSRFIEIEDLALAGAIGERLRSDPRVANFGEQWMLEERVPRFSRGDLRRFRDYIQEQEQPLTDEVLVQDILGVRPGSGDYDVARFAVNYRLSKEHRDFDFVGTPSQRFWSTSSLAQIGTTRRKPNEIGSDYRFLIEETAGVVPRSISTLDHVLTFYEYHLGLLPYDERLQALLPAPVLANQRSAVLTFECPQSYTTYLVELRYPTPNRGGFILGLDDFFNENLVPGALVTIEATENDGHYLVRYIQAASQQARLLELEDRRQRYVFRPTTYACGVIDEYLLTEARLPGMAAEKPLDEKNRRRAESVIAASFERLGQRIEGTGFTAAFDDLLAAVNIERPFSERSLRTVLDNDETGAFAKDPDTNDAYTYVPGTPV